MGRSPDGHSSSVVPTAIGASAGGIVVGLLAGAFGVLAFRRWRGSRGHKTQWENPLRDSLLSSDSPRGPHEMAATGGDGREFIVEPFGMPSKLPSSPQSSPGVSSLPGGNMTTPTMSPTNVVSVSDSSDPASPSTSGRRPNVYVVHHDGGHAPVTVYTEEGAAVVELPPQYPAGSTSASASPESEASREVDRRRSPGTTPRKTREPRSFVTNE
jgi:hypothetical protein